MKKPIRILGLSLVLLIIILCFKAQAQVYEYNYTEIVPFPGTTSSQSRGINDLGHIVGIYQGITGGGGFVRIEGVSSPVDGPGGIAIAPWGINNSGYIVGEYFDASWRDHGFLIVGNTFTTIDFSGAYHTKLQGINDMGIIVGSYWDGTFHGFVKIGDSFETIDFPGAGTIHTSVTGINNLGHIVGTYNSGDNTYHGFLKIGDTFTTVEPPGATVSTAWGINDFGHIVGRYAATTGGGGFLKVGDEFINIDIDSPFGINNSGQIVGGCGMFYEHGFLASPNTPEQEIDDIQDFFDSSVNGGTLTGVGPTPRAAKGKLGALRNIIKQTDYFIDNGLVSEACQQLRDAYLKTDGQPYPPDLVFGDGVSELVSMIQDLMAYLGCE